jgi:predicted component of type VI protein secretion system
VPDHLDVLGPGGHAVAVLDSDRMTIGKAASNDVTINDARASRLHAVLERYGATWCVCDLASRNGTFVNGQRVWTGQPLRAGDEILIGQTRMLLRTAAVAETAVTEDLQAPPRLTPRERDVLMALCRPVLAGNLFTEPATTAQIAEELVVSEPAVRQHLLRLYGKFAIYDGEERRRLRLANEVIRRGAVSLTGLRCSSSSS